MNSSQPTACHIDIAVDVYVAQTKLISTVDEFMSSNKASSPVKVVADLLFGWLTSPTTNMTLQANQDKLYIGFELINFLTELHERKIDLEFVATKASKEVSHE
jgi:hypothetical protein